ncbi:unnamed protein product [Hydatigera taeniaeformis]|uniref:Ovule protein n=1 Tax=Hydatigena taeniaeformis TaxID=6205 RepID=A0A0R3WLQ8_HYDTA|nr:unnamed protein product [Hydatigera taeniaeformis]
MASLSKESHAYQPTLSPFFTEVWERNYEKKFNLIAVKSLALPWAVKSLVHSLASIKNSKRRDLELVPVASASAAAVAAASAVVI